MSLSSRIVQRGVATIREVEEALARQVLYGADLVTNLLEVCQLDEGKLVPVVAEELGLPPAPIGELPRVSDEARRLVAAEVAVERAMAPISVDQHGLVVAVAEPLSRDAEQELTFALAVPIAQQVAPLVRIRQALARDYAMPLDRRYARLLQKLKEGAARTRSSFPPMRAAPQVKAPPRPPSVLPPPVSRARSEPVRSVGTPQTLLRVAEPPPARPLKRRRGPLTLDVVTSELEEAVERDTIFDLLFEFSRQFFDYTTLFVVHGDVAEGRDAWGQGSPREKVARMGVPLDLPSLLASARDDKKMVRGVGDASGVDGVLRADLGRPAKSEMVVLPVVVRTRVVALLVGDGGEGGIDPDGLRDVQAVTKQAVAAFERLIVRRKLKGSIPAPKMPLRPDEASERPAVEELAAPIRDLMAGPPSSRPTETVRQPTPEATLDAPASTTALSAPPAPVIKQDSVPPPPNLLAVRRPSGAPIPREEPESAREVAVAASSMPPRSKSSGSLRRAKAPPLEFAAQPVVSSPFSGAPVAASETERRLLAEIHGSPSSVPATTRDLVSPTATISDPPPTNPEPEPSPQAASPPPPRPPSITDVSPTGPIIPAPSPAPRLVIADDEATPAAPAVSMAPVSPVRVTSTLQSSPVSSDSKPMPPSEQVISVAAHRPPSSRDDSARGLPSVIVDVSSEYVAFVERVVKGDDDEAEGELLRAGGHAMPAIMARFPGPVTIEPERLLEGVMPRVADCGPVLRLVASQRRTALPYVLALVHHEDAEKRFWATYLLTELVYPDAVDPAIARVFDEEGRVRRAARAAARALAEAHPSSVVDRLAPVAQDKAMSKAKRLLAIDTLGETREPLAVSVLIKIVDDPTADVASAARDALTTITRHDFGNDAKKWSAWWSQNKERHRLEWLIDALMHDQRKLRAAAGEDLKTITKEYFGYYDDLPKRERERAQARYREWWTQVGRVRFSRASTRGG